VGRSDLNRNVPLFCWYDFTPFERFREEQRPKLARQAGQSHAYRTQVQLYALALQRATNTPTRAILLAL